MEKEILLFVYVRIQQQHVLCGVCGHQQSRLKPVCVCKSKYLF